jgi:hypothetical protein
MDAGRGGRVSGGERRVSTDERERAAERLREELVDGRLTLEEFSNRLDLVYRAETSADLAAVEADLPAPRPPARPASRWVVAVMGGSDKKGRRRVAERLKVLALMGGCVLDLREAELESTETTITCTAVMGGVEIVLPEGVEVEVTGFALMGGNGVDVPPAPPGAPRLHVRAFSLMGGVDVKVKPGRRRLGPPPPLPRLPEL